MTHKRIKTIAIAAVALGALHAPDILAQDAAIPPEYAELPGEYVDQSPVMGTDSVETVTRTRWIRRPADAPAPYAETAYDSGYYQDGDGAYAYPVMLSREDWLEECYARTRGLDDDRKGGVIGALLGAITGGIIGNRAWDSERLAGTLIGGGIGGIAGAAIGSAIDKGRDRRDDRYDCDAALDRYLSGGSYPAAHRATRSIPPYGGYGYASVMAYAPAYYAAPYQQTMIEVREEIPQRVVVRETVREESYREMGTQRIIEDVPAPSSGKITPVRPANTKIRPIKGN